MQPPIPQPVLKGAKALVVGIANEHSIAYGCARAFRIGYIDCNQFTLEK